MRVPKSRWAGVGISVVVVVAVAGITLAVTTVLGVTFQGSGKAEHGAASEWTRDLLLTANRDRLAVCVQPIGVDAGLTSSAKARIEDALQGVAEHPYWQDMGLSAAVDSPVVDVGCPSDPPAPDPDLGVPIDNLLGHRVSEASYYRLFVFVLPQQELDAWVGGLNRRSGPQESICSGDVCFEVTTGLYLTAEEVDDVPFVVERLNKAIGLEDPG